MAGKIFLLWQVGNFSGGHLELLNDQFLSGFIAGVRARHADGGSPMTISVAKLSLPEYP